VDSTGAQNSFPNFGNVIDDDDFVFDVDDVVFDGDDVVVVLHDVLDDVVGREKAAKTESSAVAQSRAFEQRLKRQLGPREREKKK